ncbi:MAG: hypothetical protein JXA52_05320 [Planctomycetes bacterium]|nr:hypothetical protein [Planctomycetota bacterium]
MKTRWVEYLTVFLAFTALWFCGICTSGALTSGWHFMDDHEIIKFQNQLTGGKSVTKLIQEEIEWKSDRRVRPFYPSYRIIKTALLGPHPFRWQIHDGAVAVLTSFFLYLFCRLIGLKLPEAIVFPLLTLLGPQANIYFLLAPTEAEATFFLSLALLFMGLEIHAGKRRTRYQILFILCLFLMILPKETFILMIPAVLLLRVWLTKEHLPEGKWREAIKKNLVTLGIMLGIFIFGIIYLRLTMLNVTTNVTSSFPFAFLPQVATDFLKKSDLPILLVSLLLLVWIFLRKQGSAGDRRRIRSSLLPIMFLSGLIFLPQLLAYTSFGKLIQFRYRLPAILAFTIPNVFLTASLGRVNRNYRRFILILLFAYAAYAGQSAYKWARCYTGQGRVFTKMLRELSEGIQEQKQVLIVGDMATHNETVIFLKHWFDGFNSNKELYLAPLSTAEILKPPYNLKAERWLPRLTKEYEGRVLAVSTDPDSFGAVFIFPQLEELFFQNNPAWVGFQNTNKREIEYFSGGKAILYTR